MAITIDATVGGASSNSYVTLAEADAYIEGRLNASTWETDAVDDTKNRALVEARRDLDSRHTWAGRVADDDQALQWPRDWVVDPDSPTKDFFSNTVVPQRVKDAQMELAFQYVKSGTTDVAARDAKLDVRSESVDVIRTVYEPSTRRPEGLQRFPRVWALISPLLAGGPAGIRVVRG